MVQGAASQVVHGSRSDPWYNPWVIRGGGRPRLEPPGLQGTYGDVCVFLTFLARLIAHFLARPPAWYTRNGYTVVVRARRELHV